MKFFLVFALIVLMCGCETPSECLVLCNRAHIWTKACDTNSQHANLYDIACENFYAAVSGNRRNTMRIDCWLKLATWIAESGGPAVDCTKPPPEYLTAEAEEK